MPKDNKHNLAYIYPKLDEETKDTICFRIDFDRDSKRYPCKSYMVDVLSKNELKFIGSSTNISSARHSCQREYNDVIYARKGSC